MSSTREGTTGEQLVAAFLSIDEHDRSYRALAVSIDAALRQQEQEVRAGKRFGCQHCCCTCDNCAPCGETND